MPLIKTPGEIEKMKKAGHELFRVMEGLEEKVVPGISTLELNDLIEERIRSIPATPAFLGYNGFPAAACISLNEEVVHGIPDKKRIIAEGDLVKIDVGLILEEVYADMARSYVAGTDNGKKQALIEAAKASCERAGELSSDGAKLGTLGSEIQQIAESRGFSVVRDYVGHGIGEHLHEDPQVPNYGIRDTGFALKEGMVICIEPMVNAGGFAVSTRADGWTVETKDKSLSAHWENMYLVGKDRGIRINI